MDRKGHEHVLHLHMSRPIEDGDMDRKGHEHVLHMHTLLLDVTGTQTAMIIGHESIRTNPLTGFFTDQMPAPEDRYSEDRSQYSLKSPDLIEITV